MALRGLLVDYEDKSWGYCRSYHHFWDAIWMLCLTASEQKVVGVIYRQTIGWKRLVTRLTDEFIASQCNLTRQKVNKVKNALLSYNILISTPDGIGVNLYPSTWLAPEKSGKAAHLKSVPKMETQKTAGEENACPQNGDKECLHNGDKKCPQNGDTKRKERKKVNKTTTREREQHDPESEDSEVSEQPGKPKTPKASKADHGAMFDAMKAGLPGARGWGCRDVLSDARKRLLDNFWKFANRRYLAKYGRPFTLEDFEGYLAHICENMDWTLKPSTDAQGRNWQARDWDYFLRVVNAEKIFDGTSNSWEPA